MGWHWNTLTHIEIEAFPTLIVNNNFTGYQLSKFKILLEVLAPNSGAIITELLEIYFGPLFKSGQCLKMFFDLFVVMSSIRGP